MVGVEVLTAARSEGIQRRVAGGLLARGARVGDRVVVPPPDPQAGLAPGTVLSAVVGALRVGVVPVVLHGGLLDEERAPLVADADPHLDLSAAALAALAEDGPPVDLAPDPLARPLHYTSGTTGRAKGVWSGVLAAPAAAALRAEEADLWGFAGDDVHLVCSPLYHSAPIRFAAGTLLVGGTVVLPERFDAATVAGVLADGTAGTGPATSTFCVPAHLQRLFALGGTVRAPRLRLLAHAGAPCPLPLKERTLAALPAGSVWEFYGSTEGQLTACGPDEAAAHPGSVGRARPGRRLRVDDDGTIWCAVPPHARFSYWRDAERTARAWRADRFTVGDLGRLDADGYLWLDGRRDDLVITGGVNVYPLEVEQALEGRPGIEEVAVFGVDDERWGQRVCLAYTGTAAPDEVLAHAAAHLAPHKRPKEAHRVGALPLTPTGKLRRLDLPGMLGLA